MKCCQDRPQLFPKSRGFCVTPSPLPKWKKSENFPPTSTCVRHVVCVIFSRQSTRWVGRWKNGNGAHRFAQRFVSAGKKRIPKMVKHPEHIIYGLLSQQFYWLFASSESPRWQFRKLSLIVSTLDRCNVQAALVLTECPSKVMKATGRWMWMWMWIPPPCISCIPRIPRIPCHPCNFFDCFKSWDTKLYACLLLLLLLVGIAFDLSSSRD